MAAFHLHLTGTALVWFGTPSPYSRSDVFNVQAMMREEFSSETIPALVAEEAYLPKFVMDYADNGNWRIFMRQYFACGPILGHIATMTLIHINCIICSATE